MASGQSGLKRFVLWDYPRASWQYDVIVALILAFVFLTPRDMFRDQPKAASLTRLPVEDGATVYWVEPGLLQSVDEADRSSRVAEMLRSRYGKRETVLRLEPVFGSEQEVTGYMAYTRP